MKRPHAIIAVGVLLAGVAGSMGAEEAKTAITKPSDVRTLSFVRPGPVAKLEVPVDEGDQVKAGQVVARQDDAAEQLQLALLKLQAEDTTRIEYAKASFKQAEVDLAKTELAHKFRAATDMELEHARLNVLIEEAKLKLAHIEAKERTATYQQTKIQVDRMKLISPIDGRVERIFLREGEVAEALGKMIIIVQNNPLWIEVPVPIAEAKTLTVGQDAQVKFTDAPADATGKVIHKASVADAASNTLMVRVEVPNPTDRPAGEHVRVSFPPAKGAGE